MKFEERVLGACPYGQMSRRGDRYPHRGLCSTRKNSSTHPDVTTPGGMGPSSLLTIIERIWGIYNRVSIIGYFTLVGVLCECEFRIWQSCNMTVNLAVMSCFQDT